MELLLIAVTYVGYTIFSLGMLQHIMGLIQCTIGFLAFPFLKTTGNVVYDLISTESPLAPPMSIFIPAYNEGSTIEMCVNNLTAINYPNFKLMVINDGSSDNTLEVLQEAFELERLPYATDDTIATAKVRGIYGSKTNPNLIVIDKENGGKSDSLNAGLNACRTDLFCVIDADSVLAEDALTRGVRPFVENPGEVLAVGGGISAVNNLDIKSGRVVESNISFSILENIQALEYFRSFLLGRIFWDACESTFIISGAFGIFDRQAVLEVGGYRTGIVGEDIDLAFKLKKYATEKMYRNAIRFIPDPVCWTETPGSLSILSKQRRRWQTGMIESLIEHHDMVFNRKYGWFGWLVMPYLIVTEILFLPLSFIGYLTIPLLYALGYFSTTFFLLFVTVEFLIGIFISSVALQVRMLQKPKEATILDMMIFNGIMVIENFGFRQLCTLWRFAGFVTYLKGDKSWGAMKRTGL